MDRVPVMVFVAGIGVLAAWLAGSAGARSRLQTEVPVPPPEASPFDPMIEQIRSQALRLERYRREASPPHRGVRNPFRFESKTEREGAVAGTIPARTDLETEPAPPWEGLDLIGIAEDPGPDGRPIRTAVITGGSELYLVTVGERFGGRFTVAGIEAGAASILDEPTGEEFLLRLK